MCGVEGQGGQGGRGEGGQRGFREGCEPQGRARDDGGLEDHGQAVA